MKIFHIFLTEKAKKFRKITGIKIEEKNEVEDKGVWDSSTVRNRIAITPPPLEYGTLFRQLTALSCLLT